MDVALPTILDSGNGTGTSVISMDLLRLAGLPVDEPCDPTRVEWRAWDGRVSTTTVIVGKTCLTVHVLALVHRLGEPVDEVYEWRQKLNAPL